MSNGPKKRQNIDDLLSKVFDKPALSEGAKRIRGETVPFQPVQHPHTRDTGNTGNTQDTSDTGNTIQAATPVSPLSV